MPFTKKFDAFARDLLRALEDRQRSDEACIGLIIFDIVIEALYLILEV